MGRRHSIAARKASWDAKKSAIYAKIGRIIQLAAKKWADASMNPSLELALHKARYYWLPRDVIDKAIMKWSGQLWTDDLEEVVFEWYWPGGTAILIKALTENTNRTSMVVKTILWKLWGSLGKPGSVAWQFVETWIFVLDGKSEKVQEKWNEIEKIHKLDLEASELELMDLALSDIEVEWDKITVYCEKSDFSQIQEKLLELNYHVVEWELHFLAGDLLAVTGEDLTRLKMILQSLDDDDDVSCVYHNGDLG